MATLNRPTSTISRLTRMGLFVLMFACVLGFASQAWSATYYVSKDGNDSYSGLAPAFTSGSSGPFRTFQHAAYALRPGDTVQIRGGTYVEYGGSWGYSTSGTEASPITITAYPGETVIIDGANHTIPAGTYNPLMQVYGDWYRVSNIEFRYGSYAGLNIIGDHCVVDNVYSHHNQGSGIFTSGDYNTIQNCRVHYNSMDNQYGAMPIGWGFGISLCAGARYSTIRGCTSWNNWGEGLSIASGYYCTIEDNVSYDNFSTNIYLSQSVSGVVRRNLSYYTNGNPIQPYVSSQNCIFAGDEGKPPDSTGNMIVNNLTLGGDRGLLVNGRQFQNLLVAYNTFVNAFGRLGAYESGAVFFNAGSSTGGRFVNNIILQEDGVDIGHQEATGVSFASNNWSRLPVSGCRGAGDVNADPKLLKASSVGAGELSPGWFKIQETSPARGKAVVLSLVTEDFTRTPRGNPPDIGAFNGSGATANLTASASGTPTSGQSPLTVNFSGSASGGAAPYTYQWTFGDGGSSASQNPSHIYASSGRYTATLTAVDGNRTSATATVSVAADATIDSVLTAYIGASSVTGQAPFTVTFTGSANGGSAPYTYSWVFGDGGTSASQNPSHTYASAGTYAIRLTVTDRTATTANYDLIVNATAQAPTALNASYVASPPVGQAPLPVRFAATASGGSGPYSYRWAFGDGSTSTSQNPEHIFAAGGTYSVTLTVRDRRFAMAFTTTKVQVTSDGTTTTPVRPGRRTLTTTNGQVTSDAATPTPVRPSRRTLEPRIVLH